MAQHMGRLPASARWDLNQSMWNAERINDNSHRNIAVLHKRFKTRSTRLQQQAELQPYSYALQPVLAPLNGWNKGMILGTEIPRDGQGRSSLGK